MESFYKEMKLNCTYIKYLIALLAVTLMFTACDDGGTVSTDSEKTRDLVKTIPPATLTAISEAAEERTTPKPDPLGIAWSELDGVEIDFWYIGDINEQGTDMIAVAERFNRENEWGIRVIPHDQGSTSDPLDFIETAFEDGLVPHVMVSDSVSTARWYQEGITLDLVPYMSDPSAGMASADLLDYYPGIFDPFMLPGGVRPGLPFTQTIQVIYYNQTWAAEMDFTFAPGSLPDLIDQTCMASESDRETTGIILYPEADNISGWVFSHQGKLMDADKGVYQFSSLEMIDVAEVWQEFVQNQCGSMISQYPNPMAREIEFARFNTRQALMIMNSSRYYEQIHPQTDTTGREDDWTMLPFLGPDGTKAVSSRVQAGVIFKTSSVHQMAGWLFLKYLTSPEIQAEWVQYSPYYPTRKASLQFLGEFRTENPDWAKGLNLLEYSWIQPVDPSWDIVQQAVGDAFEELLSPDLPDPGLILSNLEITAAELKLYSE